MLKRQWVEQLLIEHRRAVDSLDRLLLFIRREIEVMISILMIDTQFHKIQKVALHRAQCKDFPGNHEFPSLALNVE